jgi:Kef-type K+ transport system membrane component KefB
MMPVVLEKGDVNSRRKSILIGGAIAGMIAVFCALAFATILKGSENRI